MDSFRNLQINGLTVRTYVSGEASSSGVCLVLVHGAGSSALTWHLQFLQFSEHLMLVAPDMRGHGASSDGCMSIDCLVDDVKALLENLSDIIGEKRVVLIGHSLGASVVVRVASEFSVAGVIALDLAEQTAIDSLGHMETVIESWPNTFQSAEEYAKWSVSISRPQSLSSALVSTAALIQKSDGVYTPRSNILQWKSHWLSWFEGFDDLFLRLRAPHLLIMSHAENLDTALITAHMQGMFQLKVMTSPFRSHFLHEDSPDELFYMLVDFLKSKNILDASISISTSSHIRARAASSLIYMSSFQSVSR